MPYFLCLYYFMGFMDGPGSLVRTGVWISFFVILINSSCLNLSFCLFNTRSACTRNCIIGNPTRYSKDRFEFD